MKEQIKIIIEYIRKRVYMNINWYPGHMAKTKKQIQEDLKLIDVVVEILDARIPVSSQNPDISTMIKNKKRIILLNKTDLSDETENKKWEEYFRKNNIIAIRTNGNTGTGLKEMLSRAESMMAQELQEQAKKGRIGKSIRIMIVGIPNVGKSSIINKLTKKTSALVGNRPGVTRQKQWIRLNNKIELLDTPGVLWPKFQTEETALNLSYIGTIKDDNLDLVELSYHLLKYLYENYPEKLKERYKLQDQELENTTILELTETIARKRGALKSGNCIDEEKIARIILEDFRTGKTGKITLERCKE